MTQKTLQAFVDRIEGTVAVLLVGENNEPINIPIGYLPQNVEEGTVVDIHFEVNAEATREAKERTAGLIERLRRRNA